MKITRRTSIQYLLASLGASALPSSHSFAATTRGPLPWSNWAGTHTCLPETRSTPRDLDELVSIIRSTQGSIRAVGAGHSWSPLVPTDGTLLSLRRLSGLIDYDAASNTAKIAAGTKLSKIGPALQDIGQAMVNLPDIDEQSLAGALATGTHGAGLNLKALHGEVTALTLVTAAGEVIECSRAKNADLFAAAQVSLGALGIIVDYTLQNQPAYKVERKTWLAELDDVLENGETLAGENRSFEYFYIPFSNISYCLSTNETDQPITGRPPEDAEDDSVEDMRSIRDWLSFSDAARSWVLRNALQSTELPPSYVDLPWKVYPNDRVVPIYEMEYQLPLETGPLAMREIVDYIESNHPEFFVPIEYRYVDGDDAWLSEYYGRKSVSISVHRYREGTDPWNIYTTVEAIFRKYRGRPHWGKIHNRRYEDLKPVYPKLEDFRYLRRELDPEGKFLNVHVAELLGEEPPQT